MSFEDLDTRKLSIIKDWNEEALKKFSGFDLHPYDSYLVTPFGIVFITRPKLFIKTTKSDSSNPMEDLAYRNMANHPYLSRFIDRNAQNSKDLIIADMLSYSTNSTNRSEINNLSFIPLLTNRIKQFNVESNSLSTAEQGLTKHGYRHVYPTHNIGSLSNGMLSFDVNEMADLEIGNLIGIWYNTVIGSVNGDLRANPEYVKANRLDYVSSLYYFKLDKDAQTIKYWAKYNGVFPTNVPSEAHSWQGSQAGLTHMNISFAYDSREELTLSILDDFNSASIGSTDLELSSRINLNDNTLDMFQKDYVLERAGELVNKVPLVYFVEEQGLDSLKNKKRFVLKLGNESVYKSASEELFGRLGSMGNRSSLYDQE